MGVIVNKYNKEKQIFYTFYESSNILYSELIEKKDELKDLIVVFKGGRCYKYFDVHVQDGLYFSYGFKNNSIGESFNNVIIKKGYKFEKLENADLTKLEEFKQQLLLELNTNKNEIINENTVD